MSGKILGIQHDYFEEINIENSYTLGYIAADGCVCRHSKNETEPNRLIFNICNEDHKLIEYFKSKISPNANIGNHKYNDGKSTSSRLSISSKQICRDLIKYGIIEQKTWNIQFPNNLHKEYYFSYLRGLFDGDGCFYIHPSLKNYAYLGICSLVPSFIEQVKDKICMGYGKIYQNKKTKVCDFRIMKHDHLFEILSKMYISSLVCLRRKYNIAYQFCDKNNFKLSNYGILV